MARTRSGTGRGQRLLLFAALLLGIVGMHTLGHPSGHDAAMPTESAHVAMAAEHGSAATVHERPDSPGHSGMDPLNVCLAVLGSLTLLLLTAVVLRPLLVAVAPGPRARGLALAQRPNPPPPRRLLSQLSVLRI
ncbi:DUF6153 family protein [Streptomyces endophyticus]|uniref:DUF6153 family protein n=1 Tax=Streptomyces endophyticus TaxID=714166 RepID=A0ABU6FFF6_9ACTN|nr:DUF6153 family protein [Streptomyces endophyticus]MEB8342719.1 DUF6153 family protein [Streptomyces endophyticus]